MKDWVKISAFFLVCIILGFITLYRLGYFESKEQVIEEREYVESSFDQDVEQDSLVE